MGIRLFDLLSGLSGALDLMSTEVVGHHKRVAAIASRLARQLGLGREARTELFMAAILHDVGGFTLQSRLAALNFETDGARHAEVGYRLLRTNPLLDSAAVIVRHHHTSRVRFSSIDEPAEKLQLAAILNLADRADVLLVRFPDLTSEEIMRRIRQRAGYEFNPDAVEALAELTADREFWASLKAEDPTLPLCDDPDMFQPRALTHEQLMQASTAFSQVIDFRSRFTATHSRGVAETAVCLAEKAGMSAEDQASMRLAGNLHDLGKLAVPAEIIDKPGPLDNGEMAVMRRHPLLGGAILNRLPGLERVAAWAAQHHEQPGGRGYPNGLTDGQLSLGSRVMSVADVFTALREDRPYRAGLDSGQTKGILSDMARAGALDKDALALALANLEEIDERRVAAQANAAREFREFYTGLPEARQAQ